MQSSGDVFCGKSRIISATSHTVTGSGEDSVAKQTRARAEHIRAGVDVSLCRMMSAMRLSLSIRNKLKLLQRVLASSELYDLRSSSCSSSQTTRHFRPSLPSASCSRW